MISLAEVEQQFTVLWEREEKKKLGGATEFTRFIHSFKIKSHHGWGLISDAQRFFRNNLLCGSLTQTHFRLKDSHYNYRLHSGTIDSRGTVVTCRSHSDTRFWKDWFVCLNWLIWFICTDLSGIPPVIEKCNKLSMNRTLQGSLLEMIVPVFHFSCWRFIFFNVILRSSYKNWRYLQWFKIVVVVFCSYWTVPIFHSIGFYTLTQDNRQPSCNALIVTRPWYKYPRVTNKQVWFICLLVSSASTHTESFEHVLAFAVLRGHFISSCVRYFS